MILIKITFLINFWVFHNGYCGRLKNAPQRHPHPSPPNLWMRPYSAKSFHSQGFCNGRLPWMIWVSLERNQRCTYRQEVEGDLTTEEKAVWPQTQRLRNAAISQGTLAAPRRWKKEGMDYPLKPLWGTTSPDTLSWALYNSFWTLASRTTRKFIFLVLSHKVYDHLLQQQ